MLLSAAGGALFYLAFPSLSTAQLDQPPLGAPTHAGAVVAMLLIMGLLLPLPFLPISLGIEGRAARLPAASPARADARRAPSVRLAAPHSPPTPPLARLRTLAAAPPRLPP